MDTLDKPPCGPGEELFDMVIRAAAVWGTAAIIGEGINRLLIDVLPRGWRMGISLVVVLLSVGTIFWGGERWPRLRDAFFAWRYPIAMLLAAYVGYQWHAHDYAHSAEARLNEAMRLACAKSQLCQKVALDYLADKEIE